MLQGSTGSDRAIQEYCSVLQRATGVLQSIARYECRVLCRGVPDSAEDCRNTTNDHRHATGENYGLRQSATKNYTALLYEYCRIRQNTTEYYKTLDGKL